MQVPSPGGLEPPTFRLTAERANRLRHGDNYIIVVEEYIVFAKSYMFRVFRKMTNVSILYLSIFGINR